MLRITRTDDSPASLRVEGSLTASSVAALRTAAPGGSASWTLDLAGVGFADAEGVRLLADLAAGGARLVGASPFLRELLRQAEPSAARDAADPQIPPRGAGGAALVEALRLGDVQAKERMVRQHLPDLLALAQRLCGSVAEARVVVRAALTVALESPPPRTDEAVRSWLRAFLLREVLSRHEPEANASLGDLMPRFDARGERTPDEADHDLARGDVAVAAATVRQGLARLPRVHRALMVLCDGERLDHGTAGALVGLDPTVVRTMLHQARQALRLLLGRAVAGASPAGARACSA
jgi:DNA-directed RNA polymerase specialized sigma24 family protein